MPTFSCVTAVPRLSTAEMIVLCLSIYQGGSPTQLVPFGNCSEMPGLQTAKGKAYWDRSRLGTAEHHGEPEKDPQQAATTTSREYLTLPTKAP